MSSRAGRSKDQTYDPVGMTDREFVAAMHDADHFMQKGSSYGWLVRRSLILGATEQQLLAYARSTGTSEPEDLVRLLLYQRGVP